jgi:Holliday junction resolvasome RuvABC ATP-dependent DNA helicase subunit
MTALLHLFDAKEQDFFAPRTLEEFIGQKHTVKLLNISLLAASNEQRNLPNILLTGAYGVGKTTLAKLVSDKSGKGYRLIDGNSVNKQIPSGNVIIDEIHNVDSRVCDTLNTLLDDGKIRIIGCTSNPGELPAAFRSRFRVLTLERYSVRDLESIVKQICNRKGMFIAPNLTEKIASRSRSNARQVVNYLSTIFDLLSSEGKTSISGSTIEDAFSLLGVDKKGYTRRDKEYIAALSTYRPVGLVTLSAIMGLDKETLQYEIEPYLLQTGVIDVTKQGRIKLKEI